MIANQPSVTRASTRLLKLSATTSSRSTTSTGSSSGRTKWPHSSIKGRRRDGCHAGLICFCS
jgi:hypothetical protein